MDTNGCTFKFVLGREISFEYSADSVLPITFTIIGQGGKKRNGYAYLSAVPSLSPSPSNCLNISKAQDELLIWHGILDHYNIKNIQKLMSAQGPDHMPTLITTLHGVNTYTLPL